MNIPAWPGKEATGCAHANVGKQEEVPVASFEIRTFGIAESWRMERLRRRARNAPGPTD